MGSPSGRLEAAEAAAQNAPPNASSSSSSSAAKPAALCAGAADDDVSMPTMPCEGVHRTLIPDHDLPFSAVVARPVNKAEVRTTPAAQQALQKEWDKLRAAGCWNESGVREWADVAAEARRKNAKAHVGMIFDICVEKGSELPKGDPGRNFKGRVVFQGNNVQDENWNAALFQELGSSPATMEAGKACDAFGLAPGHAVQQADAEQAYIQSKLGGETPTWVRLPAERRPGSWKKYRDPVCPLILALYGHPDPGGYWERHCHEHLTQPGFKEITAWRSCYMHEKLQLFLVVYVDDFKLAGPVKNLDKGWQLIRQRVRTEDPTPLGKYLG